MADLNDDKKSGNNSGPVLKMSAKERGDIFFLHFLIILFIFEDQFSYEGNIIIIHIFELGLLGDNFLLSVLLLRSTHWFYFQRHFQFDLKLHFL